MAGRAMGPPVRHKPIFLSAGWAPRLGGLDADHDRRSRREAPRGRTRPVPPLAL